VQDGSAQEKKKGKAGIFVMRLHYCLFVVAGHIVTCDCCWQRWLRKSRLGQSQPFQSWTCIQLATSLLEKYANTLDCKRFVCRVDTISACLILLLWHRNAYRSTSAEKRELDRCMDTIVQEQREAAEVHRTVRECGYMCTVRFRFSNNSLCRRGSI
jgi:hypothetical protein